MYFNVSRKIYYEICLNIYWASTPTAVFEFIMGINSNSS